MNFTTYGGGRPQRDIDGNRPRVVQKRGERYGRGSAQRCCQAAGPTKMPSCRMRHQIHRRRRGGHGRREPEGGHSIHKLIAGLRQVLRVDALQRIERFDFDVQELNQRGRQRSDLGHIAADEQLRHIVFPELLQVEERQAQLARKPCRELFARPYRSRPEKRFGVPPVQLARVEHPSAADDRQRGHRRTKRHICVHIAGPRGAPQPRQRP